MRGTKSAGARSVPPMGREVYEDFIGCRIRSRRRVRDRGTNCFRRIGDRFVGFRSVAIGPQLTRWDSVSASTVSPSMVSV